MKYKDMHGTPIKVGDVLIYDEGRGFGRAIEEVVKVNGELHSIIRVGAPEWTVIPNGQEDPINLKHSTRTCSDDGVCYCSAIADVPHDEAFTAEFAESVFSQIDRS